MTRPNVILIVLDAVRKDHLSCYGYSRETTPNLDAFARDATRYESAISTAPWTPPSHASLFTGKYPSRHRVTGFSPKLDSSHKTIAEALNAEGYHTFGFSNSHHTSHDRGFDRGFEYYHDIVNLPRFRGKMYEPSKEYFEFVWKYVVDDYDISYFQLRKLGNVIENASEPLFGFINLNSAHSPYDPPGQYLSKFGDELDADEANEETASDLASEGGYRFMMGELGATEAEWNLVERWYDGEIRYMDRLLGRFISRLKNEGMYENTLIVVTSDHGEHFGERGLAYHQFSLYEQLLNVPLLVKWPGSTNSSVSEELVSLVDIAPTILDVVGIDIPSSIEGRSLRSEPEAEAVFAEYAGPYPPLKDRLKKYGDAFTEYDHGLQAIRTHQNKLMRSTKGESTLYRITPEGEIEADDPERAVELRERLDRYLTELPDEGGYEDEEPESHIKDRLEKLGYM